VALNPDNANAKSFKKIRVAAMTWLTEVKVAPVLKPIGYLSVKWKLFFYGNRNKGCIYKERRKNCCISKILQIDIYSKIITAQFTFNSDKKRAYP
jgi:hypothetical protein